MTKQFDHARRNATVRRLRGNVELARCGQPLVMPKPLVAVSMVRDAPEHVVITNIGAKR